MAKSEPTMPLPDSDRELTLGEMIGHTETRAFLKRAIESNRLPRAILITGPEGIGKKTLAWSIIKQVIAEGADAHKHPGCGKVVRRTHPDVRVIESFGVSGQIVIDTIRDLEDWAATAPTEAPLKFGLITPADAMNLAAANALLKILEEPSRRLALILTASDPGALLPTIRSRCTPLPLDAVPMEELVPWLEKRSKQPKERVELAAVLSEGRPGFALDSLEAGGLEQRKAILQELALLKSEGFAAVFGVADRLNALGAVEDTLNTALLLLRDSLTVDMNFDQVLNHDLKDDLRGFAAGLSPEGILKAANVVSRGIENAGRYYSMQSQAQFMELLAVGIGRELRSR
jgi:DNA polymerase-3 subunit delta'